MQQNLVALYEAGHLSDVTFVVSGGEQVDPPQPRCSGCVMDMERETGAHLETLDVRDKGDIVELPQPTLTKRAPRCDSCKGPPPLLHASDYRGFLCSACILGAGTTMPNPIETAFAWVKAHVRRTPTRSIRDIPAATYAALAEVSGDLAKAWMRHSNYVFDP